LIGNGFSSWYFLLFFGSFQSGTLSIFVALQEAPDSESLALGQSMLLLSGWLSLQVIDSFPKHGKLEDIYNPTSPEK